MLAFEIQDGFGLDHLRRVERPEPSPGPGQVLLAVRAVALNYRDLLTVQGRYDPRLRLPLVPCSDALAEVLEVGEGVTRVSPGDRVCPIFAQDWIAGEPSRDKVRSTLGGPRDGTLRQRLVLPAAGLVRVPGYLSAAQAATFPCAGLTAWSALAVVGSVGPGDTVLVLGTGGVALFALQLAQLLGARVVVTSSRDEKLERARQLGAWAGLNYARETDWGRRVKELTGGRGVDHVIEVGGAETLPQSLRAVRIGGTVSLIGNLSANQAPLSVIPILMQQVRVQGILVGHREGLESLLRAAEVHELRPVVDRVFPFDESRAAFEHLASGTHFGKVVVEV